MKYIILKNTAIALLVMAQPAVQAANWSGNVGGVIGQKSLDDSDWSQLDKQSSIGVLLDFKQDHWPLSIATDFFASGEVNEHDSNKDEGYSAEHHLGVRKIFEIPDCKIKPYFGGGLAFVYAEQKNKSSRISRSEDDTGIGVWVGTGAYVGISEYFNLGLDLRFSDAEVTVFGEDRSAGGFNAGMSAGYHW